MVHEIEWSETVIFADTARWMVWIESQDLRVVWGYPEDAMTLRKHRFNYSFFVFVFFFFTFGKKALMRPKPWYVTFYPSIDEAKNCVIWRKTNFSCDNLKWILTISAKNKQTNKTRQNKPTKVHTSAGRCVCAMLSCLSRAQFCHPMSCSPS